MATRRPNMTEEELEADRARARYADKMRKRGTPLKVLPHEYERAKALVLKARAFGMDDHMIAQQVGNMKHGGIYKIRTGISSCMHRDTYEAIIGNLRPEEAQASPHPTRGKIPAGSPIVGSLGPTRRAQALRADGFTNDFIGELLGVSPAAVSYVARHPSPKVFRSTYLDYKRVYDKLAGSDPEDHGIPLPSVKRAKTVAARLGWAPSTAWDDDTIDDPDAIPEWTGECGTPEGYLLHLSHSIFLDKNRKVRCEPCVTAKHGASPGEPPPVDREFVARKLREGLSHRVITEKFDISRRAIQSVSDEMKANGWTPNKRGGARWKKKKEQEQT